MGRLSRTIGPGSVDTGFNPWTCLAPARPLIAVATVLTTLIHGAVTVFVIGISADFRMHTGRRAEAPLITGADLLTDAALRHTLSTLPRDAAAAPLINLTIAVVVTAVPTDLRDGLGTWTPDSISANLGPPTQRFTGALVSISTLIGEAFAIDTTPIRTVTIVPASRLIDLTHTVDNDLPWRTDRSVSGHDDAPIVPAALTGFTIR